MNELQLLKNELKQMKKDYDEINIEQEDGYVDYGILDHMLYQISCLQDHINHLEQNVNC